MTRRVPRFALAIGAGLVALGLGAGVYAAAQDQNTSQPPPPFSGRGMGPGRGGRMGPEGPMGPGGPMGFLPMLGRGLQLTDAQRDQIKSVADSHRDEWKALADRARPAHDALNAAVSADTVDEGLVRQKAADLAAVEADMAVARAHAHAEVWPILTDDQKAQLKTMKGAMRSRMRAGLDAWRARRGLLERFGL